MNQIANNSRQDITEAKRWVIKIGSSLLTANGKGLDHSGIACWVEQMATLLEQNIEVVLVSSGAIAEGMARLGWKVRPSALYKLQAAAAVGQMGLVQTYEHQFQQYGRKTAQVLLDHDDISNRERYLNARNTLKTLLELGVIPVINENDTVVTDQIRFGDNDTLAAMVANLIDADLLVILTDQDGLFDTDPRNNPEAQLISLGRAGDPALAALAGDSGSNFGRGGMITKLKAAQLAARSGAHTIIVGGDTDNVLTRLFQGEELGTLLIADSQPIAARKRWLAGRLKVCGSLVLDQGAVLVLREQGKSLLPVGVKSVIGSFHRGDLVSCIDEAGIEVGRGLVNYSAIESSQLAGKASYAIASILGYCDDDELIHRDNFVLCE